MVLGMDRGKCWRWEAVQHLPQMEVAGCLLLQHVFKEATVAGRKCSLVMNQMPVTKLRSVHCHTSKLPEPMATAANALSVTVFACSWQEEALQSCQIVTLKLWQHCEQLPCTYFYREDIILCNSSA